MRHSVFIIGNAGTGKSMVWKTLIKTYQMQKKKPIAQDLNPKAVTNDELFGMFFAVIAAKCYKYRTSRVQSGNIVMK